MLFILLPLYYEQIKPARYNQWKAPEEMYRR
jgi:hypothetical protein